MDTSRIDHDGGMKNAFPGFQFEPPAVRGFFHAYNRAGQMKTHVIRGGLLTQVDRQFIGAADASGLRQKGADGVGADKRFPFTQLRTSDDPQTRDTILPTPGEQLLQAGLLFVGKGQDERRVAQKWRTQLAAPGFEELVAPDVEASLQGSLLRVIAAVDDGTVGLGGPFGDVLRLIEHGDGQIVTGQLPGDGGADDSGADDGDIQHVVPPVRVRVVRAVP